MADKPENLDRDEDLIDAAAQPEEPAPKWCGAPKPLKKKKARR